MHQKSARKIIGILCAILFGATAWADDSDLVERQLAPSPDARNQLELTLWNSAAGPYVKVNLTRGQKRLFALTIPPEKEPRYAKLSWSPSSDAALVAVNFKDAEDWILIRIAGGRASSSYFDGDQLVLGKMLETLPFREEYKSYAGVGRVPWNTVRWTANRQCRMSFIFRGSGYEGTAQLLIDYRRRHRRPRFSIVSITPRVKEDLWTQVDRDNW